MNFKYQDSQLTIYLQGKIDTTNAADREAEINQICEQHPAESVILDCEELLYISSFGLRALLRLRKKFGSLRLTGVSVEVYEVFETTGFTEIMPIEKAFPRVSVDGCKVIGKGAKGTVYRVNPEIIIKVYNDPDCLGDIRREQEMARRAFVLGLPTALSFDIVRVGDKFGTRFELLDAKSFSELIVEEPEKLEYYVGLYADTLRLIHETVDDSDLLPEIKPQILERVELAAQFLSDEVVQRLRTLVEQVPDTKNLLHCDYHTNNIMMQNGEPMIIDLDSLSVGHPIFELANVYITYVGFGIDDPTNVEKFLKLPYLTAIRLWEIFIRRYLQTDDEAVIREVEKKASILSNLRIIRHTLRRNGLSTELGRRTIERCAADLTREAFEVDTLVF